MNPRFLFGIATSLILAYFANAQTKIALPILNSDPFAPTFQAFEQAMAVAEPQTASGASAAATPAQPADAAKQAEDKRKKERLAAINKLVFDRRPSAILKVWAAPEQAEAEKEPEPKDDDTKENAEPEPATDGSTSESETEDKSDDAELTEEERKKKAEEEAKRLAKEKAEKERQEKEKQERELFAKTTKILTRSVTLGEWQVVAETLSDRERLSDDEAIAAYNRLLDQLGAQAGMNFDQVVGLSDDMRQFMQSMMSNRRNNPALVYAEKHQIAIDDLVGIIRSAPAAILAGAEKEDTEANTQEKDTEASDDTPNQNEEKTDEPTSASPSGFKREQLSKIARLVQLCLSSGSPIEELVATLKDAGDSLLPKQNVAQLLSLSGKDTETGDFLPTLAEAVEEKNLEALNLLAKHSLALYRAEPQEKLRLDAWECTLAALEFEDDPKKSAARAEALTRAVMLAPKLADGKGEQWLQESFTKQLDRGQELLAKLGTATAQRLAQMPQDANSRGENLELQSAAVEAFLETETPIDEQWNAILNLLAANWLQEANVTWQYSSRSRYGSSMRRDRYGNLYYVEENATMNQGQQMALRRVNPVKVDTILETAPEGKWFEVLPESLRPQYTAMMCRLWLKLNEAEKAFPYIESLANAEQKIARELAEEFLRVWTKNHNPNQERQRTNYYMFVYGYEQKADKIPLTRSKQERNLKELSGWIKRLSALPFDEELDESLLVSAFMTCHSVAEVYDIEDIEAVFGTWGSIEAGTMAKLVDKMRSNLGGLWRDPNVQRDSKTKRKKKDIQDEVLRGYKVAKNVLNRALEQHPGNWQLLLSQASILHDENDFAQEVSPSSEFSQRRGEAFKFYAQAADSYIKLAPDLPEREQSNEVFDRWFYAALGAADLAGVSEDNRADARQVAALKQRLDSFPGEVGEKHRERLANSLFTRMSAVSPACKFRYLEAGFQLVDEEDPKAVEARKIYDYYRDLVTELELVARVDGDARVGHESPFGVYVDLRHTKEIERESGGFAKYLQNQKSGGYFSYNYGRPTEDYRDKFEAAAAAALEEHFEILSVTFNHSETKSRQVADGWRITPYAHLLLKARGPEVDKLPSLKIDLDFLDTSGYVVLPIDSSPIPIDASESVADASATENLDLVQLLDERQSAEGRLIVETRATARGLIPDIETLLETDVDGFTLTSVEDSDVSVIEFDKESVEPAVLSERTWTLKYEAEDAGAPAPEEFTFPTPVADVREVKYQRYVDADLEDVEAKVALVSDYGSNRRAWMIAGLCGIAGIVLLTGVMLALRSGGGNQELVTEKTETAITPFGLLTQLRDVEQASSIPEDRRTQLRQDISAIESHYFADTNGKTAPDLTAIATRWAG